jgi:hypothetical protein
MRGKTRIYLIGSGVALAGLLALAGCGGGIWQFGAERAPWRAEAEAECLKSGAVKLNDGVVQMTPIDGPGMCGAEYPLKVSALGEGSVAMSYGDEIRPPGSIPNGSMPRWPVSNSYNPPPPPQPQYDPPPQYGAQAPVQYGAPPRDLDAQARDLGAPQPSYSSSYPSRAPGEPMQLGPQGGSDYSVRSPQPQYQPQPLYPPRQGQQSYEPPRTQPAYNAVPRYASPPQQDAEDVPDDIPDDAVLPNRKRPPQQQRTYNPPQRYEPPKLGPSRPMPVTQVKAAVSPPATLACPIVSALDKWVSESVQPAALRWFNQPVVEIKQISSYSCRQMVGAGPHISEHAFGNALDIAGFILADGRKVMVKTGWNGAPEEAGFLHDVQGAACNVFTTVLAPGYNVYHYDHIHVDLMRRASGRTPCRPNPIPGEVAAAKQAQKSKYAHRGNDRLTTGSIGKEDSKSAVKEKTAVAGEDGEFDDDE